MRSNYDAVVIGTGFGGSVAACRLAQAGLKVGIIERGRRYPKGSFPRDWSNPANGWLWAHDQGLLDVKPINEMTIIQGAGYGGGSLIYANVHLRAPADLFAAGWPRGYTRAALDPYYDLVAYMLDIKPITASAHLGIPPKTAAMKTVADKLGRSAQFCYPNIAVNFAAPHQTHKNKFNVDQEGCNYCGECDIGCNYLAKNTLDLNYLAVAEQHGADVAVQCEVVKIEESGNGYKVTFKDYRVGGGESFTQAPKVFVCAGAVTSTELLLRCRDQHKTLPRLSPQLGNGYSGNGDFLAFAFDTAEALQPSNGPTITTGIVYDRGQGANRVWFIFQEGGYPKEIGGLLQLLNPAKGWLGSAAPMTKSDLENAIRGAGLTINQPGADGSHSAIFLAMGRDKANGRIQLAPLTNVLSVQWDVASNQPLYDAETGLSYDIAAALGGKAAFNPFWQRFHLPVSVHNLGGCPMADDVAHGVTDANGEVFGYRGLYVLDGAILPSATGVNPSHTIAAVAERNVETVIRRIKRDTAWRAPQAAQVQPVIDPLTQLTIPAGSSMAPTTQTIGLGFTETMKGFFDPSHVPPGDYLGAEKAGQGNNCQVVFTLTITFPNLDAALADKAHAGIAKGVVHVDGFTGPDGAPVPSGVFNLFVEAGELNQRKMLYALPFTGADGKPYLLDGFKDVKDHGSFDVWAATSTLYTVIRAGHERTGAVVATGVMHILIPDFMHQLTTFQVSGTDDPAKKADAIKRFGHLFMGTLWDVFAAPRLPH
jgi:cholesterol oxidase